MGRGAFRTLVNACVLVIAHAPKLLATIAFVAVPFFGACVVAARYAPWLLRRPWVYGFVEMAVIVGMTLTVHLLVEMLDGRPASIAESVSLGACKVLRAMGLAIALIGVLTIALSVGLFFTINALVGLPFLVGILVGLVVPTLVALGIATAIGAMVSVSIQALVVEDRVAGDAIDRSRRLAGREVVHVAGVVLVGVIAGALIVWQLGDAIGSFTARIDDGYVRTILTPALKATIVMVVLTALYSAMTSLLYVEVRPRSELDVDPFAAPAFHRGPPATTERRPRVRRRVVRRRPPEGQ